MIVPWLREIVRRLIDILLAISHIEGNTPFPDDWIYKLVNCGSFFYLVPWRGRRKAKNPSNSIQTDFRSIKCVCKVIPFIRTALTGNNYKILWGKSSIRWNSIRSFIYYLRRETLSASSFRVIGTGSKLLSLLFSLGRCQEVFQEDKVLKTIHRSRSRQSIRPVNATRVARKHGPKIVGFVVSRLFVCWRAILCWKLINLITTPFIDTYNLFQNCQGNAMVLK